MYLVDSDVLIDVLRNHPPAYHFSHGMGVFDAVIAACAVGRDLVLLTFNTKHRAVVPDLTLKQPYKR